MIVRESIVAPKTLGAIRILHQSLQQIATPKDTILLKAIRKRDTIRIIVVTTDQPVVVSIV